MKKLLPSTMFLILLIVFPPLSFITVKAQSSTVIVVPDDYPKIAWAIGNASSGDTILIRSGTYLETSLTIDKSLKIIGQGAKTTTIQDMELPTEFLGSSLLISSTAINIAADNVIIANLTVITNITGASMVESSIDGGGIGTQVLGCYLPDGITLSKGSYQLIDQNLISGLNIRTNNTFAVNNNASSCTIYADSNIVYRNKLAGLFIYEASQNLISGNVISDSNAGVDCDISAGSNNIAGNIITNCSVGLVADQGGGGDSFFANTVVNNNYAVATSGYKDTFYDNNFINNTHLIGDPGSFGGPNPTPVTYWSNGTQGNYWSQYNGFDSDRDGIGDTLFVIDTSNKDPYPLMSPYNFTTVTLPDWATNISPFTLTSPFPNPSRTPKSTTVASSSSTPSASNTPAIPEFPSWIAPILLIIMAAAGLLVYFKKRRIEAS